MQELRIYFRSYYN